MCSSVGGCEVLLGSELVFVFSGTDYAEDQDNYNDNNNENNGERDHCCYDGGGYLNSIGCLNGAHQNCYIGWWCTMGSC